MKKFPREERENGLLFDDVFHAKFPSTLFIDQLSIQDFERQQQPSIGSGKKIEPELSSV